MLKNANATGTNGGGAVRRRNSRQRSWNHRSTPPRHPEPITSRPPRDLLDCPTCGRAPWTCPACRSPHLVPTPECSYWAVCRDCGFPIGGGG